MPSSQSEEPTEMTAMTEPEVTFSEGGVSRDSEHRKDFFKRFRSPTGKCILGLIIAGVIAMFAFLLAKMAVGTLYINSCRLDKFVPIYLITSAALLMVFILVFSLVFFKCHNTQRDDSVSSHHLIALVYFFLHLVLQLAGSVCVIRTHREVTEVTEMMKVTGRLDALTPPVISACDVSLVKFAYGVVIFELVLSGLVLVAVVLVLAEVIYLVCCSPCPEKQTVNR